MCSLCSDFHVRLERFVARSFVALVVVFCATTPWALGATPKAAASIVPAAKLAVPLNIASQRPPPNKSKSVATSSPTSTPNVVEKTSARNRTEPIPTWFGVLLSILGVAIFALLIWILLGAPGNGRMAGGAGPALLAALPIVAAVGFVLIRFAPDLGDGKWVVVVSLAAAILVAGGFLGFLYGLPVVDPDAVKAAGTAAGTFTRPSTKLDKVIDTLMPALTGGLLTYALTQASHFSTFFIRLMGLPTDSASNLLGISMLAFFGPVGFELGYSLTATVGALAFKRAEETLVNEAAIVGTFPPFPDLATEPTEEQRCAARAIVAKPYGSLSSATEKATWARAQALLEDWPDAMRAFQDAIVLEPRDPDLILDYAVAIYNDPSVDNIPLVIKLLDQAQSLLGSQATQLQQRRMNALRAVALLYQPNGYEQTIQIVNAWISSGVPVSRFGRYYRACAFGQLFDSCAPTPLPASAPYATIAPADFAAIKTLIDNDIAITLAIAPDNGRKNVRMTIDPSSPLRTPSNSNDDDLQLWATDDPELCAMVGLSTPPPPPTTPRPPAPLVIPNPLTAGAGVLAIWITQNCPT